VHKTNEVHLIWSTVVIRSWTLLCRNGIVMQSAKYALVSLYKEARGELMARHQHGDWQAADQINGE